MIARFKAQYANCIRRGFTKAHARRHAWWVIRNGYGK